MFVEPFEQARVLTGPTGSGKTSLGVELARALDAEIISMDSMALYRGMDIGTAKPTAEQRRQVRHHMIDVLDPWQSATVAWWLEKAALCVRDIRQRGKQVLFVGGTPLYLKALMFGLFEGPPADAALRQRLTDEANERGDAALHDRLARVDGVSAARLHPNDRRRVVRALEVYELTGKPISDWQQQWPEIGSTESAACTSEQPRATSCIWLDLPRAELYRRIDRRVEEMFQSGLVEECRQLLDHPQGLSVEAGQALGYKEVIEFLSGNGDLASTLSCVQKRTRNLAKRQVTWFRHLPGCVAGTSELTWKLWQPKIN